MPYPALNYQAIFGAIPGKHLILMPEGNSLSVIEVSTQFLEYFGLTREKAVGHELSDLYHAVLQVEKKQFSSAITLSISKAVNQRKAHQIPFNEVYGNIESGKIISGTISHSPVFSPEGDVLYIIHTLEIQESVKTSGNSENSSQKDLTAEQMFRRQLTDVFYNAPVAIAILKGQDYKVDLANAAAGELFDRTEAQALQQPVFELFPKFAMVGIKEELDKVRKTGKPFIAKEFRYEVERLGQKKVRYYDFVFQPVVEDNNITDRIIVVITDVSDKVYSRKAVEESEQRLNLALETAEIGVWDADLVTGKVTRSPRHANIFGNNKALEDWSYEAFLESIHEEDREHAIRLHEEALLTGKLYLEVKIHRPDGQIRWIRSHGIVLKTPEGHPYRMIGTAVDITQQKLAEASLQQSAEELEYNVLQRTADLLQANHQLEKINKQMEEFAYAASHDLQEPLRKIITLSERLMLKERELLSEDGRQTFDKIASAARRMKKLINDLFVLSKVSHYHESFQETDLNQILRNIEDDLQLEINRSGAQIIADKLPIIKGIPMQLHQLFLNLVSNSLKYAKADMPPIITIRHRLIEKKAFDSDAGNDLYNMFEFADNGIGFEPEYSEKIFQLFQRLHGIAEYIGTGIGLSICKKIAENHKGFIEGYGEPGKGAKFIVYLKA